MTGNRSYLTDYEEINGGFVAFRGKFDGKADEGFFVGYSTNSKAFIVFNNRTRIVEENLHVKFNALTKFMNYKPVVVGNQSNGSAGTKACDNVGKTRVETVPDKDYILLPLWTQDLPFSFSLKGGGKKDDEDPRNEDSEVPSTEELRVNQKNDANVNSTNNINTVSPTDNVAGIEDNFVDENIVYGCQKLPPLYGCADDPNIPDLEEISRFGDAEDDNSGADMNNLDAYFQVSYVPTTRIHKDHPLNQVIGDLQSATQTRQMTKNLEEYGFVSTTLKQRTRHKDLSKCLFACFLSQKEPKKIEEEVYVCQPPGFEDPDFPDRVYKVEKVLYGLHQAPKAWNFRYLKGQPKLGLWYPKDSPFDFVAYTDSDYARASLDRKSTTGGCQFLGCMLISWQCKKQTVVVNSITEAEVAYKRIDDSAKKKIVNGEEQLQALMDRKKVIITKATIRRDLQLDDAEGVDCLPSVEIFELTLMGYENISQKLQTKNSSFPCIFLIIWEELGEYKQIPDVSKVGKCFSGKETPLFLTMIVQAQGDISEGLAHPTDPHHTPTITQPSTSTSQKKQKPRKPRRQDTEKTQPSGPTTNVEDEDFNEENVSKHSNDPLHSESYDEESLGEEDASKQGRNIDDIDVNKEITLVDKTVEEQGRFDDQEMFDIGVLDDEEVVVEKAGADKEVSAIKEVNAASITTHVSVAATTPTISMDKITLANELIEIKTSRSKAKGIVKQEPSKTPTPTQIVSSQQPSKVQDKGKGIMVEEPLKMKKKDQISFDNQEAQRLQAKFNEEERLASVKNKANNARIEQWHDV
nr:ribonuclease H-like domain, reverse transcriptase, RNA-dependent DNA polymerase [Tanacetum cinerariifolium]